MDWPRNVGFPGFPDVAEAARASLNQVFARLQTSPHGLSWKEAARRLDVFGPNELRAQKPPEWYQVLWTACKHPFNAVLTGLAVISLLTGDIKATVVMLAMVVLNVGLRFWQEMKSHVQAESLRRLVHTEVTVVRSPKAGVIRKPNEFDRVASDIPTRELVPGDIVKLSAGDLVPADMRLIESRDLFVTQSALTGEAMPVEKYEPDRLLRPGTGTQQERLPPEVLDSLHLLFMGTALTQPGKHGLHQIDLRIAGRCRNGRTQVWCARNTGSEEYCTKLTTPGAAWSTPATIPKVRPPFSRALITGVHRLHWPHGTGTA